MIDQLLSYTGLLSFSDVLDTMLIKPVFAD
jgi:hypothetical protein